MEASDTETVDCASVDASDFAGALVNGVEMEWPSMTEHSHT